jgi:hypothetical protein
MGDATAWRGVYVPKSVAATSTLTKYLARFDLRFEDVKKRYPRRK